MRWRSFFRDVFFRQSKLKLCAVGFMQLFLEQVVISTWGLQESIWNQKIDNLFVCTQWPFSWPSHLTLKKGIDYLIFWVLQNRYGPRIFQKVTKEINSVVICLSIEYNGGYSSRWPSGCRISKAFYCFLNFILLSLSVKWYVDMISSYWNINTKPPAQSFHFDCRLF